MSSNNFKLTQFTKILSENSTKISEKLRINHRKSNSITKFSSIYSKNDYIENNHKNNSQVFIHKFNSINSHFSFSPRQCSFTKTSSNNSSSLSTHSNSNRNTDSNNQSQDNQQPQSNVFIHNTHCHHVHGCCCFPKDETTEPTEEDKEGFICSNNNNSSSVKEYVEIINHNISFVNKVKEINSISNEIKIIENEINLLNKSKESKKNKIDDLRLLINRVAAEESFNQFTNFKEMAFINRKQNGNDVSTNTSSRRATKGKKQENNYILNGRNICKQVQNGATTYFNKEKEKERIPIPTTTIPHKIPVTITQNKPETTTTIETTDTGSDGDAEARGGYLCGNNHYYYSDSSRKVSEGGASIETNFDFTYESKQNHFNMCVDFWQYFLCPLPLLRMSLPELHGEKNSSTTGKRVLQA